jgi:hypothetical protein
MANLRIAKSVSLALAAAFVFPAFSSLNARDFNFPQLGSYGRLKTYCGKLPISVDPRSIPQFGCFVLSPGHAAKGAFFGHQVTVAVDASGQELFTADGIVVEETKDSSKPQAQRTNVPFVHNQGTAGYTFCQRPTDNFCPAHITVFERNPNKTILFTVSECLPPTYQTCVMTQENWDYEVSRVKRP